MSAAWGRIAVVGATGAVGREALAIFAARGVPAAQIVALASDRSAGLELPYGADAVRVAAVTEQSFAGCRAALFAADADTARKLVPAARRAGCVVVDNSSAFRMDPGVPLVVPEVNGRCLDERPALIANPNCSAAILLVAVEPLRARFGITRIVVATYQAVSGAGIAAMDELRAQARAPEGSAPAPAVFREPCAFNVFSHDSAVDAEDGLNVEERKLIEECRKITGQPDLAVTPTCVRVPVLRAHTEAITVTLARAAREDEVRAAYAGGAGLEVVDDRRANAFPTPLKAAGRDAVLVGRLRPDPGVARGRDGASVGWCLLASGDQLRKGAALNAVQILERVLDTPH